jgi:Effector Associated Constant Component 1
VENPIHIELHLKGDDTTEQVLFSLQNWIRNEGISSLKSNIKQGQSDPSAMGVDPITVLSIILSSSVLTEFFKSLNTWSESRRSKIKIVLKVNDKYLEIDAENLPDSKYQVEKILAMLPGENQDSE